MLIYGTAVDKTSRAGGLIGRLNITAGTCPACQFGQPILIQQTVLNVVLLAQSIHYGVSGGASLTDGGAVGHVNKTVGVGRLASTFLVVRGWDVSGHANHAFHVRADVRSVVEAVFDVDQFVDVVVAGDVGAGHADVTSDPKCLHANQSTDAGIAKWASERSTLEGQRFVHWIYP